MNEIVEIETKATVEITPARMAEIFWNMSDHQQADFFHELAGQVEANPGRCTYGMGEMQWCFMGQAIRKRGRKAWEMFLAFSAFAYDYWPQKSA